MPPVKYGFISETGKVVVAQVEQKGMIPPTSRVLGNKRIDGEMTPCYWNSDNAKRAVSCWFLWRKKGLIIKAPLDLFKDKEGVIGSGNGDFRWYDVTTIKDQDTLKRPTINITLPQWQRIGTRLFGEDRNRWEFVCPSCGNVTTATEFTPYVVGDFAGASRSCIGIYLPGKKNEPWTGKRPCTYAPLIRGDIDVNPVILRTVPQNGISVPVATVFAFNGWNYQNNQTEEPLTIEN